MPLVWVAGATPGELRATSAFAPITRPGPCSSRGNGGAEVSLGYGGMLPKIIPPMTTATLPRLLTGAQSCLRGPADTLWGLLYLTSAPSILAAPPVFRIPVVPGPLRRCHLEPYFTSLIQRETQPTWIPRWSPRPSRHRRSLPSPKPKMPPFQRRLRPPQTRRAPLKRRTSSTT